MAPLEIKTYKIQTDKLKKATDQYVRYCYRICTINCGEQDKISFCRRLTGFRRTWFYVLGIWC